MLCLTGTKIILVIEQTINRNAPPKSGLIQFYFTTITEEILSIKYSIWGKISFISLILWTFFIVLSIADQAVQNYSFYKEVPQLNTLSTFIVIMMILLGLVCFITGLISVFDKDTKKILPTISLSVIGFMLFLIVLFIIQEASLVYIVKKGVVTNYGIWEIPYKMNHDSSAISLYEQRYLKNNTEDIPASIGTRFGFNYVIDGEPGDEKIQVMKVTKYPEPGLQKKNKLVLADTSYFSVTMNKSRYSGFIFEHDYELLSGKWEFEIWYKEKKLLSKSFNVFYQL